MIRIRITTRGGETREIEAKEGQSLMEAIRNAGFDELVAMCGGCRSCATCHVYIEADTGMLGEMSDDEVALLEVSEYRHANSRLSCQVPVSMALDGVNVRIAPEG